MILYGIGASAIEYALTQSGPVLNPPPPPPHPPIMVGPSKMQPVRALRGLGLDAGLQSGLTIIGALAFAYFALTILAISKSVDKREKRR